MLTALRSGRSRLSVVGLGVALLVPLSIGPAGAQAPAGPALPAGTTVVGTLVRAAADGVGAGRTREHSKLLSWIEPATGAPVRVATDQVAQLPVGATVKVTLGGAVTEATTPRAAHQPARQVLAASVVAPAAAPLTAAAVTPPFTDEVTVVKVHPGGDASASDTTSIATVLGRVNAAGDYWNSQTRGQVKLQAVASSIGDGWITSTATCDTPITLLDDVASQIHWTAAPGEHLMLYLSNPLIACDGGFGEVGATLHAGGRAYIRTMGDTPNASEVETSLYAQELGHNFGLGNSVGLDCQGSVVYGDCAIDPYGDAYDVMGGAWEARGALNVAQADRLGVLPTEEKLDLVGVPGTRTVTLSPMGTEGGIRGVRLGASDGLTYWLEYRSAVGQDAWLGDSTNAYKRLDQGVLVRIEGEDPTAVRDADSSLLVDVTPWDYLWSGYDGKALKKGRSVWLSALDYYVTVQDVTPTSAVVRIQAGTAALPRDLDHNYRTDLLAVDPSGVLYRYDSSDAGGFAGRVIMGRGWQARDLITMVGDWDGSGAAQDVVARDGSGNLWLYTGAGRSAGFTSSRIIGRGWSGMSALFSPGDYNGDGNSDLIARRRSDNTLWLYPGNGSGGFLTPLQISAGWGSLTSFEATGDFDLNGVVDFITRRSDGTLFLFRGNGRGWYDEPGEVIGRGWNVFTSITGVGDWDGDGAPDLLARKTDGTMWLYPGDGAGGFLTARKIGSGWGSFRMAV